ncbi:hypothetical protein AWH62_07045 [Maricaulis sp. W15]|uniref:hypothetical protein n=1 Tax=Maricaulis sp. W15 TaxID=1772333 RepID=UPI0009488F65|nr:hypothetical protein [Maricaulis sp. W15]OLF73907.1 hypothetical protein AWH62_07045 [Maricaulis sp. W15]
MRDENSYWRGFYDARFGFASSSIGEDVLAPVLFWGVGFCAFFVTSVIVYTFGEIALISWDLEVVGGLLIGLIVGSLVLGVVGAFLILLALHHMLRIIVGNGWVFWSFTTLWVIGALLFARLVHNPLVSDPVNTSDAEMAALTFAAALILTIPWLVAQAILRLFLVKSGEYWD